MTAVLTICYEDLTALRARQLRPLRTCCTCVNTGAAAACLCSMEAQGYRCVQQLPVLQGMYEMATEMGMVQNGQLMEVRLHGAIAP